MPKWGLSMSEGKVTGWLKPVGSRLAVGDEILEVETDKIAGVVEASDVGTLRRVIGEPSVAYPVKALLGVIADDDVPDADIDSYIASYVTPAANEGDEQAGPRYEFAETLAGSIRYGKRGEGDETIVLVHGFGGDLDNWLFNIDGIDAAHLVGHSMGGAVVARTAIDTPGRVKSVTLISSAGLGSEINGGYIDGFTAARSRRELKPLLEQLFEDPGLVSRQLVDDLLKYKRLDGVDQALTALAANLFPKGQQASVLTADLARVPKPLLVIWGANDRIIPASHAGALGENAQVEAIEGAGHMVQMEKAGAVNDLVLAHIRH
jgi:pyruvate dehydrogenase E2 component (dihydrolipoamide acetyltransferase)